MEQVERSADVVPEQKSSKKRYFIIAAVIAAVLISVALWRGGDNAGTADSVGKQIEQAGRNQQVITGGIADAEITAGSVTTSIDRSQEAIGTATSAAGRLENHLAESGSLIAECREILKSVGKDAGEESTERIRGTD